MQSIQKNKLAIVKYYPDLYKIGGGASKNENATKKVDKPEPEALVHLNKLAQEYPFRIMYHTKKNDPL